MKSTAKPRFRSLSWSSTAAASVVVSVLAVGTFAPRTTFAQATAQAVIPPSTTPAVPISGDGGDLGLSPNAVAQIQAIYADKMQWTPVQQKLDSHLIYAIRKAQNLPMVPGQPDLVFQSAAPVNAKGMVTVTINGTVSSAVLAAVKNAGGR